MPMIGDILEDPAVSLYVHIPFCTRKCDYCHFYVLPDQSSLKTQFLEGLKLEWERVNELFVGKKIETLYFGGGTPYLLGASAIQTIIDWIASLQEIQTMEITLEANPENMDPYTLKEYRAAGINRLSVGLQSLDDHQLITLSRRHTAKKGIEAIEMAFDAGFTNISIDLMYDLPNQTLESWTHTVERATQLPISHLSLYNLTIEPHTVFFKYRDTLSKQLPGEEISQAMYETACMHLESVGLHQYEISAFAKSGYSARHNSGYWTGRPFLGLGPSAFSYWEGARFRNVANLSKYFRALYQKKSPVDFHEKLPHEAHQRELLTIALRLLSGVDLIAFEQKEGKLSSACLSILAQLKADGFLQQNHSQWSLTKKGILFYDTVAEELIL